MQILLLEQFAKFSDHDVLVMPRDAFQKVCNDPKSVQATLQVHVGRCAIVPVDDSGWLVIVTGGYIFIPVKFGTIVDKMHGKIQKFLALHGMHAGPGKSLMCLRLENKDIQFHAYLRLRQLLKDGVRKYTNETIFERIAASDYVEWWDEECKRFFDLMDVLCRPNMKNTRG